MSIPRRLIRTVPKETTEEIEDWWETATALHWNWDHITLRDPIDPSEFPLTSPFWDACRSGAQLADLVRAEELFSRGGVYIDADVQVLKPFDPLCALDGVASWEDCDHICNAVMGFRRRHPALGLYLELALHRLDQGTWESGVGTITEVFKDRTDLLLLPPGSFFPLHWRQKALLKTVAVEEIRKDNPWSFTIHRWAHSWSDGT